MAYNTPSTRPGRDATMDTGRWKSWVAFEQDHDRISALIHGPLEHVRDYHPGVRGVVSHDSCSYQGSPGIDVMEDFMESNATITCLVRFGTCVPSPSRRNCKARYALKAGETIPNYLRRAMYVMCDVISLQLPTLDKAVDIFLAWLDSCVSVANRCNRPSIRIVIDEQCVSPTMLTEFENMCAQRIKKSGIETSMMAVRDSLRRCFSDIVIVSHGSHAEAHSEHAMLKVALQDRMRAQCFYDARTVVRLLEKACQHFANGPRSTFCFITALRQEILPDIPSADRAQFAVYFRACEEVHTLIRFALPAIAHGLARDSYRIGCHRFSASDLFDALYADSCSTALQQVLEEKRWVSPPRWSQCTQIICQTMAAHFSPGIPLGADVEMFWKDIPPFAACILCPFRKPDVYLQCGHAICENCVWHWSRRVTCTSLCRFDTCPACGNTTALAIRLRPPTSGYRTLSLDGGGVRGIVMLEVLHHIATSFGLGLEAYQMFDFIAGTSTGSIIACTLGLKQWPLLRCIEEFRVVACAVFPIRRPIHVLISYIFSLITDCVYSNKPLIENLKRIFGERSLLRGQPLNPGVRDNVKLIVTATTTSAEEVTLSNYATQTVTTQADEADPVTTWEACASPIPLNLAS